MKERSKRFLGHRPRQKESNHWLYEGTDGQDSLLIDLDPNLYVLDQTIAALGNSVWHELKGEDNVFALLVPPQGAVPWHIGYLSKKFSVYVQSDELDPLLEQAAERFELQLFSVDEKESVVHAIDFYLHAPARLQTYAALIESVALAAEVRSDRGACCFVLPGQEREGTLHVAWNDGSFTPLEEVLAESRRLMKAEPELTSLQLSGTDPFTSELLGGFLKRNREFFGRDIRELLLRRMHEPDFHEAFFPKSGTRRIAILAQF